MRTQSLMVVAAVLLTAAGARAQDAASAATPAQQDVQKTTAPAAGSEFAPANEVEIGVRGTSFATGSDRARYQRYQDLRDGGTLDRFRYAKETNGYAIGLQADHVGYLDQRFSGSYNNFGKVTTTFEWNQTPLFYSETTQSLYTQTSPGVLVVPGAVQSGLQNKTITLQQALASGTSAFDLKTRRDVANFTLGYTPTTMLGVNLYVKNTNRNGAQPFTAAFGFSGVPDELAMPIDTRTTEFGASSQYGGDAAFLKLAYDGSFFRNNIPTLTWSNPFRASDSTTAGPLNGRMALWPNTDQNTLSVSGALNRLPGHSHATAFVSYGALSNNDPLIPFTINSAIASPALPRTTADVTARVTAMNFTFTSRPVSQVWLNARYRQYGFDDRTEPFDVINSVSYDYTAAAGVNREREALNITRHTFDADAAYSPLPMLGIRGGYTREQIDRTGRFGDSTTEDTGRLSVDVTGTAWFQVRGIYENAKRVANGVDPAAILADGEQPTLGQYDIASRNRQRVTGLVIVTPLSALSFNASAGRVKDEYPSSEFGLNNAENNLYSFGFDAVPLDNKVTFGATYGYEKNAARQGSRYAAHVTSGFAPTFFDPRADWWDDTNDNTRNAEGSIEIVKVIPRTDVKLGYDYTRGESSFFYTTAANYTGGALPVQLPAVTNERNTGTFDLLYHLSNHLGAGFTYLYEKYTVSDFALGPQVNGLVPSPATVATPSIMMLGYYYMPYTANTFWGRLTYRW